MQKLICVTLCVLITSCTYSINLIHTQGSATDLVDEVSTPTSSISPTLTIPEAAL